MFIMVHCSLLAWELPSSPAEKLPPHKAFLTLPLSIEFIELFIVGVYTLDISLMLYLKGMRNTLEKKWNITYFVLIVAFMFDILGAMVVQYRGSAQANPPPASSLSSPSSSFSPRMATALSSIVLSEGSSNVVFYGVARRWLTRPFRAVFLVCKIRTLRQLVAAMLKAGLKVAEVLALALVLLVFYSVVGVALFSQDYRGLKSLQYRDSFSSFGRASLSLTVLLTTENFPQIFFPALNGYFGPVVATLYFLTYFVAGVWVLFNLILAVVFDSFEDQRAKAVVRQRLREHAALMKAYKIIARRLPIRSYRPPREASQKSILDQLGKDGKRSTSNDNAVVEEAGGYRSARNALTADRKATATEREYARYQRPQERDRERISYDPNGSYSKDDSESSTSIPGRPFGLRSRKTKKLLNGRTKTWPPRGRRYGFGVPYKVFKTFLDSLDLHRNCPVEHVRVFFHTMCSPSTMLIGKRQWARLLDVLHLKLTRVRRPAVYGISESLSPSELQNPTVPPSTTRYGSLSLKTNSDQDEDVAASNSREASETEIEPFSVRADHTIENTIRHQFKWRKRASTLSPSQSFRTSRHNLGAVRQRASWVIWLSRYRSEAKYSLEILYKLAVYTNTFALCYYEAGDGKFDRFINVTSAVCVSIFLLELLQEAMGRGIFHHLAAKPVDAVVSLTALPIEILFWGRWLAILRAFRVLRIVTTSKKLTKLIRGIFGAMQTVLWLMVDSSLQN